MIANSIENLCMNIFFDKGLWLIYSPDFAHDHNAAWWRTSAYDHIVAECFVLVAAAYHRNKQTETDAMVLMSLDRHSN